MTVFKKVNRGLSTWKRFTKQLGKKGFLMEMKLARPMWVPHSVTLNKLLAEKEKIIIRPYIWIFQERSASSCTNLTGALFNDVSLPTESQSEFFFIIILLLRWKQLPVRWITREAFLLGKFIVESHIHYGALHTLLRIQQGRCKCIYHKSLLRLLDG